MSRCQTLGAHRLLGNARHAGCIGGTFGGTRGRAGQVRFSGCNFGYLVMNKANRTSALDDNERTPEISGVLCDLDTLHGGERFTGEVVGSSGMDGGSFDFHRILRLFSISAGYFLAGAGSSVRLTDPCSHRCRPLRLLDIEAALCIGFSPT